MLQTQLLVAKNGFDKATNETQKRAEYSARHFDFFKKKADYVACNFRAEPSKVLGFPNR